MEQNEKAKMTEMERLQARQAKLDAARKENAKKLRAAKRREAAKQKQAAKQAEIDEALQFVAFCKQHKIAFGQGENRRYEIAYDWLANDYAKWLLAQVDSGAPGRAQ